MTKFAENLGFDKCDVVATVFALPHKRRLNHAQYLSNLAIWCRLERVGVADELHARSINDLAFRHFVEEQCFSNFKAALVLVGRW